MAENVKYGNILASSRKDETLTYTKYVKDIDSGKSLPTLLDEKVGWADQIKTDNLSDASVTTGKIADSSVTTGKLANGAVDMDKLSQDVYDTLKSSLNQVEFKWEYTDVDEAGEVRHMKMYLRNYDNWSNGENYTDVFSGTVDTATTSHDGLMAGEDKQQLDAHEADLAAIHKVTDNLDSNYLRLDGRFSMTGILDMQEHEIRNIPGIREDGKTGGSCIMFNKDGYEVAFGSSINGGGDDEFVDNFYGGFNATGFTASGFITLSQTTQGLLANNGTVLTAMTDTDVTSVVSCVFG